MLIFMNVMLTMSDRLQFAFRGRISTLRSSSDIAAWIEERRKRFPTKARAEEAARIRQRQEEARQAVIQARKKAQEKKKAEANPHDKVQLEAKSKEKAPKDGHSDAAAVAQRKIEKLRKRLEKEEKRAAKALAKASKEEPGNHETNITQYPLFQEGTSQKRKRSISVGPTSREATKALNVGSDLLPQSSKTNSVHDDTNTVVVVSGDQENTIDRKPNPVPDPLTPMSQTSAPDEITNPQQQQTDQKTSPAASIIKHDLSNEVDYGGTKREDHVSRDQCISTSDSSSELSSTDSEDDTSSSGSSSTDSDDGDDFPDQASSRRQRPDKILPPKRGKQKGICKIFLRRGRCRWGNDCHYRHELPNKKNRDTEAKEVRKPEGRSERIGLHERVSGLLLG